MYERETDGRREVAITDIEALVPESPCRDVLANAKEKHTMRYTHHRGLARVTQWVALKFAAMNLKKFALWHSRFTSSFSFFPFFLPFYIKRRIHALT